jgi:hypothetical protein
MPTYIEIAINGLFTGLGAAVGTYLATKYVITHTNKLHRRISKTKKEVIRLLNGGKNATHNITNQN